MIPEVNNDVDFDVVPSGVVPEGTPVDVTDEAVEYDDADDYVEGGDVEAKYKVSSAKHGLINTVADEVSTRDERGSMSPWDVIVHMAKAMNVEIGNPKPSCKKCYGRGWSALESVSQNPIVCQCIFPKKTPQEKEIEFRSPGSQNIAFASMSREQKRKVARKNKTQLRQMAKNTFAPETDESNV